MGSLASQAVNNPRFASDKRSKRGISNNPLLLNTRDTSRGSTWGRLIRSESQSVVGTRQRQASHLLSFQEVSNIFFRMRLQRGCFLCKHTAAKEKKKFTLPSRSPTWLWLKYVLEFWISRLCASQRWLRASFQELEVSREVLLFRRDGILSRQQQSTQPGL